jgi:hypothetical protein
VYGLKGIVEFELELVNVGHEDGSVVFFEYLLIYEL